MFPLSPADSVPFTLTPAPGSPPCSWACHPQTSPSACRAAGYRADARPGGGESQDRGPPEPRPRPHTEHPEPGAADPLEKSSQSVTSSARPFRCRSSPRGPPPSGSKVKSRPSAPTPWPPRPHLLLCPWAAAATLSPVRSLRRAHPRLAHLGLTQEGASPAASNACK